MRCQGKLRLELGVGGVWRVGDGDRNGRRVSVALLYSGHARSMCARSQTIRRALDTDRALVATAGTRHTRLRALGGWLDEGWEDENS